MDTIKIIILLLLFSSCKKETTELETTTVNCNCGNVELIHIMYDTNGHPVEYTYRSRNNCTNAPIGFNTYTEHTSTEYCLNYQW